MVQLSRRKAKASFLLAIALFGNVEGFLMAPIKNMNGVGGDQVSAAIFRRSAQQHKKLYYKDDYGLEQSSSNDQGRTRRLRLVKSSPRTDPTTYIIPMTTTNRRQQHQSTTAQEPLDSFASDSRRDGPNVYCDLDGVLVDFCQGISDAFDVQLDSQNIDALPRQVLWKKVQQRHAFFEHLSWCDGGRELWDAIAPLRPSILTGVPSYCHRAPRDEKFAWCVRELSADESLVSFQLVDKAGPLRQHLPVRRHITPVRRTPRIENNDNDDEETLPWSCQVITCWSERKHHECRPGDVLIDDRIDLKRPWEQAGGVFIHHKTGDTAHTLEQLKVNGIIPGGATDMKP